MTSGMALFYPVLQLTQPTWDIDWVVVLRSTQHKIGHFEDLPQANLLAWYGKSKPNITKAHIYQWKEMCYNTK